MNINTPEVREIVTRAFPRYNGRRITVVPFAGPMRLDSYWNGGYRDYWALVSLLPNVPVVAKVPENGTPFTDALKPLESLPANGALIRHTMGPRESVCVYVNAESLANLLPPATELSTHEKIVLAATRGLKSSYAGIKNYRLHEASNHTGIAQSEWESAKASCIARGLLNKAGAITDDGRNAIGDTRLENLKS